MPLQAVHFATEFDQMFLSSITVKYVENWLGLCKLAHNYDKQGVTYRWTVTYILRTEAVWI